MGISWSSSGNGAALSAVSLDTSEPATPGTARRAVRLMCDVSAKVDCCPQKIFDFSCPNRRDTGILAPPQGTSHHDPCLMPPRTMPYDYALTRPRSSSPHGTFRLNGSTAMSVAVTGASPRRGMGAMHVPCASVMAYTPSTAPMGVSRPESRHILGHIRKIIIEFGPDSSRIGGAGA
jgi:hypothetical protein